MTLGQVVPKLDALHLMDGIEGLRSLPKHSVDMLLTDPPYGTTRNFWDVPLPLPELWEAVRWAVKPNGAILFFAQCPFDKVLGASNLAMLRYEWVWYKSRATGFLNANRAPLKKSENILVFYQKSPVYHPQFTYYDEILKSILEGKMVGKRASSSDDQLFFSMPDNAQPEQYQTFVFDGNTYKSIGPFDTEEELFNALKEYTDTEVEAGTMSQAEATALLEKYQ